VHNPASGLQELGDQSFGQNHRAQHVALQGELVSIDTFQAFGNNASGVVNYGVNAVIAGVKFLSEFANIIQAVKVTYERNATHHPGNLFCALGVPTYHSNPPGPARQFLRYLGTNPITGAGDYHCSVHRALSLGPQPKGVVSFSCLRKRRAALS
jgi:hypothetical protein